MKYQPKFNLFTFVYDSKRMKFGEKHKNEEYWKFYSVYSIKMTKIGTGSPTFKF